MPSTSQGASSIRRASLRARRRKASPYFTRGTRPQAELLIRMGVPIEGGYFHGTSRAALHLRGTARTLCALHTSLDAPPQTLTAHSKIQHQKYPAAHTSYRCPRWLFGLCISCDVPVYSSAVTSSVSGRAPPLFTGPSDLITMRA